jgi:hypothetical protein
MTTPAVLYNTVPLNLDCLDDTSAIHDLKPIPIPNPNQSSSAPPTEDEEDEAYDTIFEDDDDFVLVPTSVHVPIFDEETACVIDEQTLEDVVANNSEEWVEVEGYPSNSRTWLLSILPDRVGDAAKAGVEWLVTTKTKLHRRILIAAASSQKQTHTYPWATMEEPSTTVTSEIHGELCRLMLPGPVVVFGDSMCVSLTGDEVMRPQVTASSKPTTIMVSAYDILAASSQISSSTRSTSVTRSRILESSFSGLLMSVIHYSGTKIVKSTKKRAKKIGKAGGTVVQSVGQTIVRLERRFQLIGKTSDLLIDGYERFLGPVPSNDFEDGDYTIELTS